jgi:hypothetical protein
MAGRGKAAPVGAHLGPYPCRGRAPYSRNGVQEFAALGEGFPVLRKLLVEAGKRLLQAVNLR